MKSRQQHQYRRWNGGEPAHRRRWQGGAQWVRISAKVSSALIWHTFNIGIGLWLSRALLRLAFFPFIKVTPLKESCFRPSICEWILAFLVLSDRFDDPEWAFKLPVSYMFSSTCLKSRILRAARKSGLKIYKCFDNIFGACQNREQMFQQQLLQRSDQLSGRIERKW